MKLLHIADLHLEKRVCEYPMLEDLSRTVGGTGTGGRVKLSPESYVPLLRECIEKKILVTHGARGSKL